MLYEKALNNIDSGPQFITHIFEPTVLYKIQAKYNSMFEGWIFGNGELIL